ncbi:MAG: hypothetical protein M0R75_03700 [Dehalococcoidia bacterium]|nr:hypothetical protein [Dehalococcoidia bacterium]
MDDAYQVDQGALRAAVRERDHLVFRFSTIPLRLFLDFRTSAEDGPGVFALPPASSIRERMTSMREVRPNFPRPERVNVVAWPLRVSGLRRLGVIEEIRLRLSDLDGFEALGELDRVVEHLEQSEALEVRRAITGEGYRTLWPAQAH